MRVTEDQMVREALAAQQAVLARMFASSHEVIVNPPGEFTGLSNRFKKEGGMTMEELHAVGRAFPEHKCGLYLTHNVHRDYYETVEQWLSSGAVGIDEEMWVSDVEKSLAMSLNDVWVLQWYPKTPISFFKLAGYNLAAVLEAAQRTDDEQM